MHLKLLVIDGNQSWLGSANMTKDALKTHANLMTNISDPRFAQILLQKAAQLSEHHYEEPMAISRFTFENQLVELRFLPDDQSAVSKLQELIRSAKKIVQVAMYTFTRQDLANALARASHRGVQVKVIIDEGSGQGASAKIVDYLQKEGVEVHLTKDHGLMHNKFMIVDDQILVHGSANWTKAAFKQNDDFIMILFNLTQSQKQVLHELWNNISRKTS